MTNKATVTILQAPGGLAYDLLLTLGDATDPISIAQQRALGEISRALSIVKILFERPSWMKVLSNPERRLDEYVRLLAQAAEFALEDGKLSFAQALLDGLNERILGSEEPTIQLYCNLNLGLLSLAVALFAMGSYWMIGVAFSESSASLTLSRFLLVAAGAAVGTYLSSSLSQPRRLSLPELIYLKRDASNAAWRLSTIIIVSLIIGAGLSAGVVRISVGGTSINPAVSWTSALLTGLLCGLLERNLRSALNDAVIQRTHSSEGVSEKSAAPRSPSPSQKDDTLIGALTDIAVKSMAQTTAFTPDQVADEIRRALAPPQLFRYEGYLVCSFRDRNGIVYRPDADDRVRIPAISAFVMLKLAPEPETDAVSLRIAIGGERDSADDPDGAPFEVEAIGDEVDTSPSRIQIRASTGRLSEDSSVALVLRSDEGEEDLRLRFYVTQSGRYVGAHEILLVPI